MTTFLISAVCALALGTGSIDAPKDTVNVYIIDGKKVENFDGTQLAGKNITGYVVKRVKDKAEKVHLITTGNAEVSKTDTVRITSVRTADNATIVVDGKPCSQEDLGKIDKSKITLMTVYKAGSEVSMKYTDGGAKDVIMVSTTSDGSSSTTVSLDGKGLQIKESGFEIYKPGETVFVLDGKQITSEEMSKIPAKKIKAVELRKDAKTTAKYNGAKAVMFITTK